MRENLTQKLDEVEHRLANSQQRIENCLVEMSCTTTTNFESHKEDASTSWSLVEEKCIAIHSCLTISFSSLNGKLFECMRSLRDSFRDLLRDATRKLLYNQRNIEAKLDALLLITKANQLLLDEDKSSGQKTIHGVVKSLDEVNVKLDKSMEKLLSIHEQQQSDVNIERILSEIKETLEQQKCILLSLDANRSSVSSAATMDDEALPTKRFGDQMSTSKSDSKRAMGWKSPRIQKLIQDFSTISKDMAAAAAKTKSAKSTLNEASSSKSTTGLKTPTMESESDETSNIEKDEEKKNEK